MSSFTKLPENLPVPEDDGACDHLPGAKLPDIASALGSAVYGLSGQNMEHQRELAERLHLPYPLLNDEGLVFCEAMGIPTFEAGGMRLTKRVTMIVRDGIVEAFHYPVFPSDSDPEWVLARLAAPAGGPA